MRKFIIPDVETFIAAIQDEISRTPEGRYFHRLHVILYVLQGASSYDAAYLYGHSARSIQYWIQRLISYGLQGLWDRDHPGRPSRLSRELGYEQNFWDGPLLSYHLKEQYHVSLSVRQCQRLFHKLGFTLQRPRLKAHEADPFKQEDFKKNSPRG